MTRIQGVTMVAVLLATLASIFWLLRDDASPEKGLAVARTGNEDFAAVSPAGQAPQGDMNPPVPIKSLPYEGEVLKGPPTELTIREVTGFLVSGRLVRKGTSVPVAGARIALQRENAGATISLPPTDERGRFSTDTPRTPGRVNVLRWNVHGNLDPTSPKPWFTLRTLHLGKDPCEDVLFDDPLVASIRGVVQDASGRGVPGADLELASAVALVPDGNAFTAAGKAGSDGRFVIDGFEAGCGLVVRAKAPGTSRVRSGRVAASETPRDEIVLRLGAAGSIGGRVTLDQGAKAPQALLEAFDLEFQEQDRFSVVADDEGNFEIDHLPPGNYLVTAQLPGRQPVVRSPVTVRAAQRTSLDLELLEGLRIEGTVVDTAGATVDGVRVMATPIEPGMRQGFGISAADGRFAGKVEKAGRYRLDATKGAFETAEPVEADAGSQGVRIVITRARVKVRFQVLLAGDRSGIRDADVLIVGPSGAMVLGKSGADGRTDADLTPGKYAIYAATRGRAPKRQDLEIGPADQGERSLEFELLAGRTIHGRVVDPAGAPRSGIQLVAVLDDNRAFRSTAVISDAEGRFTLDSLPETGGQVGVLKDVFPWPVAPAGTEPLTLVVR